MQKIKCNHCKKPAPNHNRVKIVIDGKVYFVCEACMDAEKQAMLKDPNHPAWQYYLAVEHALFGGKGRMDD